MVIFMDEYSRKSRGVKACDRDLLIAFEDAVVMFRNQGSREEAEQADDDEGECDPVEARVDRYAEHGSEQWQGSAHDGFVDGIGEEQHQQQGSDGAEEEHFAPQRYARVSDQRADEFECFSSVKEDVAAFRVRE